MASIQRVMPEMQENLATTYKSNQTSKKSEQGLDTMQGPLPELEEATFMTHDEATSFQAEGGMATMELSHQVGAVFWQCHRKKPVHSQNGAQASVHNATPMRMKLKRYHNWSGTPVGQEFPNRIAPHTTAHFTHLRGNQFGSKAGVMYTGFNAVGNKCAWLLAWDAPANASSTTPNEVYVACGPKHVIKAMTWNQILAKLDTGLPYLTSHDKATKTRVEAVIHGEVPNTATIFSTFKLHN